MTHTNESPLAWPTGWKRCQFPDRSRYGNWSLGGAMVDLLEEARKLGASSTIFSSDMATNLDGSFRASAKVPADKGVALYFVLNGHKRVIACDKWDKMEHNIRALALAISSMRQLDRCGASEIMERAFTGFAALPAPVPAEHWSTVLKVDPKAEEPQVRAAWLAMLNVVHPDKNGGIDRGTQRVNEAWKQYCSCVD